VSNSNETSIGVGNQRLLAGIYLAQLIVPLMILLDELIARLHGDITFGAHSIDTIVGIVSFFWLTVGLGVFIFCGNRTLFLHRASGPTLTIYVLLFGVLVFEIIARATLPPASQMPAVRVPNTQTVYYPNAGELPGVHGRKVFSVNEIGLRGPSFPRDAGTYKIITIGGSTTECAVLDDSEEWPHLLMERLTENGGQFPVWVGNAGISGHNTVDHLVLLQTLPILRRVDALIFLVGVNDLGATLAFEGGSSQADLEREAERFRESILAEGVPHYRFPLYKHSRLFRLSWEAEIALVRKIRLETRQQDWMGGLSNLRKLRASSRILPIPSLQTGLTEYHERLIRLEDQCKILRVRCLFVTQPTFWRNDLTPAEQNLLWWGSIGRWGEQKGYVSTAELAGGMNAYNQALLNTCQKYGLECYDLASVAPKSTSVFYDDQHFNEQGAKFVAQHVADYLLSTPPFVKPFVK